MNPRLAPVEHNGETRVPTIAICRIESCQFEWPVAYTPMDLMKWAEAAKRATCPMCGDKKPLLKGNGNDDKPDVTITMSA
jgi:hypothetical protein